MNEWNLMNATAVANELARERGRHEAQLLRFGSNGLYTIDETTVARISPANRDVQRGLRFATAAAAVGLPVLAPLDETVSLRNDMKVTLWPLHPENTTKIDYQWLGQAAARIHEHTQELAEACGLNPERNELADTQLAKVRQRLNYLREHGGFDAYTTTLDSRYEHIVTTWTEIDWDSPVVLHGDLHGGNVLGCQPPLLIDFDQIVVGPRAWDHIPIDVQVRRFGLPEQLRTDFVEGYGHSLTQEPGYKLLVQLRELAAVTWVAQLSTLRPELHGEATVRLRSYTEGVATPWTPH